MGLLRYMRRPWGTPYWRASSSYCVLVTSSRVGTGCARDRGGKSSLDAIDQILIYDCSLVAAQALSDTLSLVASQFAAQERLNF